MRGQYNAQRGGSINTGLTSQISPPYSHLQKHTMACTSIIEPLYSLRDSRWRGSQHGHHRIFIIKIVFLAIFIILVIVDYPLYLHWRKNDPTNYDFWFHIGFALIPDLVYTFVALVLIF